MARLPTKILVALCVPVVLVTGGTLGFHFLEGKSYFESLYLTVITLTTVGYGDIVPTTSVGKGFTMVLVAGGVFTYFYAATTLIQAIVGGELADHLGKHYMEQTLESLRDHIIVCGYGRMGRLVCREFAQEKVPYVLIDEDPELLRDFRTTATSAAIVGDATSDDVLRRAGIERARGLVTVMHSDAANLFTTMSARLLNPKLFIVARVEDMQSEQKLLRGGADRVVSPYQIGGTRVAQAILRPTVMDFIELATRTEHIDLQLEETIIRAGSPLIGTHLQDSRIRSELKIIVVAIKKANGKMEFNPNPEVAFEQGDTLVAIGHKERLIELEKLASPRSRNV